MWIHSPAAFTSAAPFRRLGAALLKVMKPTAIVNKEKLLKQGLKVLRYSGKLQGLADSAMQFYSIYLIQLYSVHNIYLKMNTQPVVSVKTIRVK